MTTATLIYNPNAGWLDLVTPNQIKAGLEQAGYDVFYTPTEKVEDLDNALAHLGEVVVVAGGDGTVRATALRLLDRDVSLAILPMGTANNIARTLGLGGPILPLVAGLADPRPYAFDVGYVEGPWGEDYFLEVCGMGFFAHAVAVFGPQEDRSWPKAFWAVAEALLDYHSHQLKMTFDDRDISGDYVIVNVFNTPFLGPNLELLHEADPGDGDLDLLCIAEGDQADFVRSLTGLLTGGEDVPLDVEMKRGKKLEIVWDGFPIHVDSELRPRGMAWPVGKDPSRLSGKGEMITIGVRPGALQILLPHGGQGLERSAGLHAY